MRRRTEGDEDGYRAETRVLREGFDGGAGE